MVLAYSYFRADGRALTLDADIISMEKTFPEIVGPSITEVMSFIQRSIDTKSLPLKYVPVHFISWGLRGAVAKYFAHHLIQEPRIRIHVVNFIGNYFLPMLCMYESKWNGFLSGNLIIAAFQSAIDLRGPDNNYWPMEAWQKFVMVHLNTEHSLAELIQSTSFQPELVEFIHQLLLIKDMPRYKVYHHVLNRIVVHYWNSILPKAIHANGNQYNEKYGNVKGKQTLAILCVVFAYTSVPNIQWTTELLTILLDVGTELHTKLLKQSQDETFSKPNQKTVFHHGERIFEVENIPAHYAVCKNVADFKAHVEELLHQHQKYSVLFSVGGSYFGIFKQSRRINDKNTVIYSIIDTYGIFTGRVLNTELSDATILEYEDFNGLYDLIDSTLLKWAEDSIAEGGLTVSGYKILSRVDQSQPKKNVMELGTRRQAIKSN